MGIFFFFYWELLIKREERNGENLGEAVLSLTLILAQKVIEIWVALELVAPLNLISSWAAIQTVWVLLSARLSFLWASHVHTPQQSLSISVVGHPLILVRYCSFCLHQSWLKCNNTVEMWGKNIQSKGFM